MVVLLYLDLSPSLTDLLDDPSLEFEVSDDPDPFFITAYFTQIAPRYPSPPLTPLDFLHTESFRRGLLLGLTRLFLTGHPPLPGSDGNVWE